MLSLPTGRQVLMIVCLLGRLGLLDSCGGLFWSGWLRGQVFHPKGDQPLAERGQVLRLKLRLRFWTCLPAGRLFDCLIV